MQSSHVLTGAAALFVAVTLASPPARQVEGITRNLEQAATSSRKSRCVPSATHRETIRARSSSPSGFTGADPVRPPWPADWAIQAPRNRGLPGYDDAQAMRLLTEGAIGRDGGQLKPPMPRFHMTKQDAADVITYMRSLR